MNSVEMFALATLRHTFYLFLKSLTIFFALNQPKYVRCLVKYHENLLVALNTHPEVAML